MTYSKVIGTGSYLPGAPVDNDELIRRYGIDSTDAWIRERSGIHQRHIAAAGETTTDLAEHAARRALDMAMVTPRNIDMIVVATTTPDHVFPSVATQLQHRLGCYGGPAFDVQAVCAGFVYALAVADRFVQTGAVQRALVVGAETFTRILDWNDRGTCVLFGDGAGAVLLQADARPGILSTHLHADGRHKELLWVPSGVSSGYDQTRQNAAFVSMKGNDVFRWAVTMLGRIVEETLEANDMAPEDIDWLIPHQANIRILHATARKLRMPMERVMVTVAEHGNTSAASVPLAFDQGVRDGRILHGQTLLLEAFGGGFTWGSALLRY